MSVSDETILFNTNVDEGENRQAAMILQEVYSAWKKPDTIRPCSWWDTWFPANRPISPAVMMQDV